jgi:hypothetical protein
MSNHLFNVHPAPGPEEVNWETLWFTHQQRTLRMWLVAPAIIILVLLPVSLLTSAATQISTLICQSSMLETQEPGMPTQYR